MQSSGPTRKRHGLTQAQVVIVVVLAVITCLVFGILGWVLLASGVLWTMLGWWLRWAPWLSLRVRQSEGPTIALGLPVPLGLTAWGVRVARPFVPRLAETGIEEMILALEDEMYEGGPILVEVDEGVGGERVHVCLG